MYLRSHNSPTTLPKEGGYSSQWRRSQRNGTYRCFKGHRKAGIPIDYVVGTSMGSIIGGLYSIGYTPEQLDSMVRRQDWTFLLSDKIPRSEQIWRNGRPLKVCILSSIRKRCQNTSHRRIDKGTKLGKPVQRADRRIS